MAPRFQGLFLRECRLAAHASAQAPPHGESVVYFKQEMRTSAGANVAGSVEEIHKKISAEAKSVATAKRESLGKQTMEGVQVEGTRTTRTIAAGEIGNDRPIDIVSERWYLNYAQERPSTATRACIPPPLSVIAPPPSTSVKTKLF